MRLESMQIDFECTRNPEHTHIRFNFFNSLLILIQSGCVCALCKFSFQISEGPVQLIYATNIQPSVDPRRKADQGNQRHDDRDDEERYSTEERGEPESSVTLPEGRAGTVKHFCGWRERQIIGLLGWELTEAIEGTRWPVDFSHGFQQQILQGRVKILSHEQSVAGGKKVNV